MNKYLVIYTNEGDRVAVVAGYETVPENIQGFIVEMEETDYVERIDMSGETPVAIIKSSTYSYDKLVQTVQELEERVAILEANK